MSITDTELGRSIYHIEMVFSALVYFVIFPHGIDEECLHDFLLVYLQREDGIHQVGIVKHDLGWFLWEELTIRINHVDESCICQILDIVHHRGAAGVNRGRVEGQGQKKLLHRLQRPRGRQGKENTAMALRLSLLKESLAAPRAILYIIGKPQRLYDGRYVRD